MSFPVMPRLGGLEEPNMSEHEVAAPSSNSGRWRPGRYLAAAALGAVLAAAACSSSVDVLNSNVQVSFATRGPAAAPPFAGAPALTSAGGDTITDGTNTLVITKAQVVLRQIQLEQQEATCSSSSSGCEDVELGPVIVDLPLAAGAEPQFSARLPSGTYARIDFEIHKVSADDPAAVQSLVDRSIHVEGTYNGQPVTFDTDLDVEQEIVLSPVLVVTDATTTTNVTVRVSLDGWFRAPNGTVLDPQTGNKGGINESLITENIKQSIQAFKDDDGSGTPDP